MTVGEERKALCRIKRTAAWKWCFGDCGIMAAHHHLLCLTFKHIKNLQYPLIKTHTLRFALSHCNLCLHRPFRANGFVKKMLIKLGFRSSRSPPLGFPCVSGYSAITFPLWQEKGGAAIRRGLMIQKKVFRDDVVSECAGLSLCIHLGRHWCSSV